MGVLHCDKLLIGNLILISFVFSHLIKGASVRLSALWNNGPGTQELNKRSLSQSKIYFCQKKRNDSNV